MNNRSVLLIFMLAGSHYVGLCQKGQKGTAQGYFTLKLAKGDSLANIYSRAIAYSGDDFSPVVYRVSGSSVYKVVDNNPSKPVFNERDLYDGQPESKAVSIIGLDGSGNYDGKAFVNSSASGLLYSELIWGPVHPVIHEGDSWKVTISQPWELGGPGTQVVKVITLDERHQTVTLQREGDSEGFFDSDQKKIPITTKDGKKVIMDVTPGTAHWTGYTTFRNGVVQSDELLVTRTVTLSGEGLEFKAKEREYILLNSMPAAGGN